MNDTLLAIQETIREMKEKIKDMIERMESLKMEYITYLSGLEKAKNRGGRRQPSRKKEVRI